MKMNCKFSKVKIRVEYGILLLRKEKEFELVDNSFNLKSTCPFLLNEKRLAIAQWSLPLIYKYAINLLQKSKDKFQISKIILFLNPEHYTCWNLRRSFIQGAKNFDFKREFQYTNLIQTKYPKSETIWNYKKWLIKKMENISNEFLEIEFDHCSKCSEIYPRNYYAWSYRVFLLNHFKNESILKSEFSKIKNWIQRHVSDHSAVHYITLLLDDMKNNDLLLNQMYFNQHLIINFPGHESLWIYRRYLMKNLKIDDIIKSEYNDEYYQYNIPTVENEISFCKQVFQDKEMERYEDQKSFAKAYLLNILDDSYINIKKDLQNI